MIQESYKLINVHHLSLLFDTFSHIVIQHGISSEKAQRASNVSKALQEGRT